MTDTITITIDIEVLASSPAAASALALAATARARESEETAVSAATADGQHALAAELHRIACKAHEEVAENGGQCGLAAAHVVAAGAHEACRAACERGGSEEGHEYVQMIAAEADVARCVADIERRPALMQQAAA